MRRILKKDNIKRYEGWWAYHNGKLMKAGFLVTAGDFPIKDAVYIEKDKDTEDVVVTLGWETGERDPETVELWSDRDALIREKYRQALIDRNNTTRAAYKLLKKGVALAEEADNLANMLVDAY